MTPTPGKKQELEKHVWHTLDHLTEGTKRVNDYESWNEWMLDAQTKLLALFTHHTQAAVITELKRLMDWDNWDELGSTGNEAVSVKSIMSRIEQLEQRKRGE